MDMTMKVKVNCSVCSVEFSAEDYNLKRSKSGKNYCSKLCYGKDRSTSVEVACKRCGVKFSVHPNVIKKGGGIYCSTGCSQVPTMHACTLCGVLFPRPKSHYRNNSTGNRFCSQECFGKFSGDKRKASGTWNKHLKGKPHPTGQTYKKGVPLPHTKPVGSISIRQHKHDSKRAWIKVEQPHKWILRAQYVWMEHNGPIPEGYIVHHHDRDSLNDDISNLRLLTRAQHIEEHRHEHEEKLRLTRLQKSSRKELPLSIQGQLFSQ